LTRHEQVTKSNHSNSLPAACLLASTTATADGGSGGAGKVVQISSLPLLDCVTYFLVVFFFVMSVTKRKAECTNEKSIYPYPDVIIMYSNNNNKLWARGKTELKKMLLTLSSSSSFRIVCVCVCVCMTPPCLSVSVFISCFMLSFLQ